ncbi:MAG TPA: sugar phosphate nucleotidyltransferase [Symbiobacteriaceae bacterium]|nr:sugar phosphate nucleotidyltransferase [Symbiobacteriaceae bacterium]
MKALVLCAGRGTRLAPLTLTRPKAAVPVAGRPVLTQILYYLAGQGLTEVGVVVAPGQMTQLQQESEPEGMQIHFFTQERPLGIADAVRAAYAYLGEEPFLLYLGDNLTNASLAGALQRFAQSEEEALLLLRPVPNPTAFGVAELDGDRVVAVWEKLPQPPTNLAIAGIYLFRPSIHQAIALTQPSARGEYEITDAIQALIQGGAPVGGALLDGWWQDMGSIGGLLTANRLLLSELTPAIDPTAQLRNVDLTGPLSIGPRAIIEGSRLIGPIWIGAGAVVRGSILGPDVSLGAGARILDASLQQTILLPGAQVTGPLPPLIGTVLGERASVSSLASPTAPPGVRLCPVLGDGESLLLPSADNPA